VSVAHGTILARSCRNLAVALNTENQDHLFRLPSHVRAAGGAHCPTYTPRGSILADRSVPIILVRAYLDRLSSSAQCKYMIVSELKFNCSARPGEQTAPPPSQDTGHYHTLGPSYVRPLVARVLERMTGGRGRKSSPLLAVSTSMHFLNSPIMYSLLPSQISKRKTRWNGFTSYRLRTILNMTCWMKIISCIAPSWRTITTSENTGDEMVGNRFLRKLRAIEGDTLRFVAVSSRDRSDLLSDRLKSRSVVSGFPVGWWVK